jgi:hypothetical protein
VRSTSLIAAGATALVLTLAPSAASTTTPSLRVGAARQLVLVGTGFKPRTLVTLRVVSPAITRRAVVRTGSGGGFTYRFPSIERCDPTSVIAVGANGVTARVPVTWFTRSCMAPPPIQPGVPPPQD